MAAASPQSSESSEDPKYPIVTSLHSFGTSVESKPNDARGKNKLPTIDLSESSSEIASDFDALDRKQFPMNKNLSILYSKLQVNKGESVHAINVGDLKYPKNVRKMDLEKLY